MSNSISIGIMELASLMQLSIIWNEKNSPLLRLEADQKRSEWLFILQLEAPPKNKRNFSQGCLDAFFLNNKIGPARSLAPST